ncbi:Hypothetical predicted protein [Mytilus galloprovincialis]|uniref:B box-type domain-containing protein n=1 Tax=Mytilus galloprovincialis TaxID=29158 RepID=A0A8B6EIS8_MYTGA|nr:Hypothetical predicted protein [Mytilus galloprovincialis]
MAQVAVKTCEICVSASGTQYCLECEQCFCENCKTFHKKQKVTKNHQFQSSIDVIPEVKSKCKDHNEDVSSLCNTCSVKVCSDCVTGSHRGHEFSNLTDSMSQLKENEKDLQRKVKEATQNIKKIEEGAKAFDGMVTIEPLSGYPSIHYTKATDNDIKQMLGTFTISENVNNPSPKKYVRTDESTQDEIKRMTNLISSVFWRERYQGITQLLEFCETHAQVVAVNATKIFDKFLPRLQDPNSKVNLFALQVFQHIIPLVSDSLIIVLNMAVGNVAPNLSSRNKEICNTAMDIISALMQNIDGGLLLQALVNQTQSASAKSKPYLVVKVAELVRSVYSRKQKQVVLYVLPLLWHLLGATNSSGVVQEGSSSIRTATHALVNSLYSEMGSALMEKAHADASVTPRHLDLLNALLGR